MFVNSNTYLLSIILTKSVFHVMPIFSIYQFSISVVQEKFIFSSSMPENLNQYPGAAGVFNWKFFMGKKHRISFSNNPFPFSVNLTIFDCFSIFLTSSNTYLAFVFFFLLNVVKYNFKINPPKKIVSNLTCLFTFTDFG